ncbi:Asp/Glu racemase [Pseudomonas sp. P115]|uniref:aspartate/glutamate racemase family protein n=1 Tax=Pseudomonas pisciculturae TaxID=2730413 RepID=UPI0018924AD4|nr:aspartate/glutamate racemase family protein [Pseudomonas pisciculturae]MBF6031499.1 Asp/Glu racemase [Pseudomonas pisciculturae]
MRIACLHTAASNIAVFDVAATALGISPGVLHHDVRADLLEAAEHAGQLTADIAEATASALLALAEHADVVVLTCSTLGPVVETIRAPQAPILRTDEALAATALKAGGDIVVLCAVQTTIEPTSRLFHSADVRLVPGAWNLFKTGDLDGYLATIASAADQAYAEGASVVVLAQASMSGAARRVTAGPPPLTSATAGLAAALAAIAVSAIEPPSPATPAR